jgi:hypothetical protein
MESTLQCDLKNADDDVLELFEEVQVGDKVRIVSEFTVTEIDGERFHASLDSLDTVEVIGGKDDEDEDKDEDGDYEEEDEEEEEEDDS